MVDVCSDGGGRLRVRDGSDVGGQKDRDGGVRGTIRRFVVGLTHSQK